MTKLTGGQALMRQLVREGVRQIFAVPGIQLDYAIDPIIDLQEHFDFCVPRHEQATSYMADGFARSTGRPAICMMVPGPGVLNATAGLSTAFACSSPVLCIAGQIESHGIGKGTGMLHEIVGQSTVLKAVTKWSALARSPGSIPSLVRQAMVELTSGRPQPVAIEVPVDVLQAEADIELADALSPPIAKAPEDAAIERAATLLSKARFPVIWAGGGVLASGGTNALQRLAERLGAPVVMSDNGRGAISDHHPLALPSLGARAVFPHADVVLVVGSRFVNMRGQLANKTGRAKLIYLNIEENDITPPREPGLNLIGDARVGLEHLKLALPVGSAQGPGADACRAVRAWCDLQLSEIQPQLSWLHALRSAIPDNGILVNELTQVGYLAPIGYPVYEPRTFITPGYQGTLGYGYPTTLGAAVGNPDKVVVGISGDGGFGWNLQELATAAKYNIPAIIVIFRDGAFGNVRRIQKAVFKREIGTELHNPDFLKLAAAFGVNAVQVTTPEALVSTIRAAGASRSRGPLLIEVPVGEMPSPWHLLHSPSFAPTPPPPNPLGEPIDAVQ